MDGWSLEENLTMECELAFSSLSEWLTDWLTENERDAAFIGLRLSATRASFGAALQPGKLYPALPHVYSMNVLYG